jgi:hypothetical protein
MEISLQIFTGLVNKSVRYAKEYDKKEQSFVFLQIK